jgi:hypothetical protein
VTGSAWEIRSDRGSPIDLCIMTSRPGVSGFYPHFGDSVASCAAVPSLADTYVSTSDVLPIDLSWPKLYPGSTSDTPMVCTI